MLWFSTWELSCPPVSLVSRKSQIPNRQTSARDLQTEHQYIDTSQIRRQKPCLEISKCHTALRSRNRHLDASDVFTGCSAIATAIATRALAVLLLFEAITLPPPRPRKGLTRLGGRHTVEPGGRPKFFFLDLDMCWLLKHNSGRNPHTEVQYMVYLPSAPHSYAVFDSATAVSWRKLQKTTSPGTLHGRYP